MTFVRIIMCYRYKSDLNKVARKEERIAVVGVTDTVHGISKRGMKSELTQTGPTATIET